MIARPAIAAWLSLVLVCGSLGAVTRVANAGNPAPMIQDANGVWRVSSTPPTVPLPILPPARSFEGAVWCPGHDFMLVQGGSNGMTFYADVWALTPAHHPSWQQIAPGGTPPAARNKHSAIYDASRDRVVIFGGIGAAGSFNDVWALSLAGTPAWSEITPAGTLPSKRSGHCAIYDSARDRMVVFGGRAGTLSAEVWSLNFSGPPTWSKILPVGGSPPAGSGQGAVYDAARDRMVVYGGIKGAGVSIETWALDFASSSWTMLDSAGTNVATTTPVALDSTRDRMMSIEEQTRAFDLASDTWSTIPVGGGVLTTSMVYDPQSDTAIGYGGGDGTTTWLLPLSQPLRWIPFPIPRPGYTSSPMYGGAGCYDPVRGLMLMWDRADQNLHVWDFDMSGVAAWNYVTFAGHPPGIRKDQRMVLDAPRDRMLVFGGHYLDDPNVVFNDVWSFPIGGPFAWQRIDPVGGAPVGRYRAGVIYDPIRDRLVVTGGITHTGIAADTWGFSLGDATWTLLSPTGTPPPGGGCNAVYDAARDRMVVVGAGGEWAMTLGDTPAWTHLSNSPAPGLSIALDPTRDRVLAVNDDPVGTLAGLQVWAFGLADSSGWNQLAPSGPIPQGRQGCTAIYDLRRDRMFITGGVTTDGFTFETRVGGDFFLEFGAPEVNCATAVQVAAFTQGTGTSWPYPDDALGAADYYPLTLGTGGSVTLRLDHPVADGAGIDFYVLENGRLVGDVDENYRVEGSPDGAVYTLVGDAAGGAHGFDLAAAGLATARYLRISDLAPAEAAAPGMAGADIDAVEVVHCATTTDVPGVPEPVRGSILAMVRPNPAREAQVFEVRVAPGASARSLAIFSAAGRRVWQRDLAGLAPGSHLLVWDGRDASGRRVPPSIYFARLETATGATVRRVVRIE